MFAYGSPVGHWPKTLSSTFESVSQIAVGGMVSFNKNERSPPMGDGVFPDSNGMPAALVRYIKFVGGKGEYLYPNADDFLPFEDKTPCYKVSPISDSPGQGYFFYYGGPGGCTD